MQRDLHHPLTYLLARVAGLDHGPAEVVATASQYVDDAINAGVVSFANGAKYRRVVTAHRAIDRRNLDALAYEEM